MPARPRIELEERARPAGQRGPLRGLGRPTPGGEGGEARETLHLIETDVAGLGGETLRIRERERGRRSRGGLGTPPSCTPAASVRSFSSAASVVQLPLYSFSSADSVLQQCSFRSAASILGFSSTSLQAPYRDLRHDPAGPSPDRGALQVGPGVPGPKPEKDPAQLPHPGRQSSNRPGPGGRPGPPPAPPSGGNGGGYGIRGRLALPPPPPAGRPADSESPA